MKYAYCFRYDNTTGVFTVPPGGDGTYFFNAYFFVPASEYARLNMVVNDEVVCTADGDHTNLADFATASCSAVVDAVEGISFFSCYDVTL